MSVSQFEDLMEYYYGHPSADISYHPYRRRSHVIRTAASPQSRQPNGETYHPLVPTEIHRIQSSGCEHLEELDIYSHRSDSDVFKNIIAHSLGEEEITNFESFKIFEPPKKCLGGKNLVLPIRQSEILVLCAWNKASHEKLRVSGFIHEYTDDQLDEILDRIIDDMEYVNDANTRKALKEYVKKPDHMWWELIPDADRRAMENIMAEPVYERAHEQSGLFIESASEITRIFIRWRALRFEQLLQDSISQFNAYLSKKSDNLENFGPSHHLFLLFKISSADNLSRGYLSIRLRSQRYRIREPTPEGIITYTAWMPDDFCIRPSRYIEKLKLSPVFRITSNST